MESGLQPDWRERYFAGEPLRIGNDVQLLLDDYMVEDRFGLRRVIGPVEKHPENPLPMGAPLPGEAGIGLRQVLYDPAEDSYKGWYCAYRHQPGIETGSSHSTLYVQSPDGITWHQPDLGLFPQAEPRMPNAVLHQETGTCLLEDIMLDPQSSNSERRFIALVKMVPPGETDRCIVMMHSADGREFTPAPEPVLFRGASDGSYSLVRDPRRDGWLLYRRPPTRALKAEGFYDGVNTKRRVSVSLSHDMQHWTHPRAVALPDEIDVEDVDWVKVTRCGGLFLGVIGLMNNPADSPKHTHLMWSRDGFVWERLPDRPQFVPNGAPGEWDQGSVSVEAVVPESDHIRIYYIGGNVAQAETRLPRIRGTGLATISHDRWVGQQAGPEGGYLLTRQFVIEGDRLEVNCRCGVKRPPSPELGGMLQAEILAEPIEHFPAGSYPGYAMEDCEPIAVTDNPRQVITWNGSPDLSALRGRPVYIRFSLRNATLYAFTVVASGQGN